MSDIAIRVENLSKQYQIGQTLQRHDTLRDALASGLGRLRGNGRAKSPAGDDTFWALKDVSFEVKRGEVVGIIGRNGAGKSTLLKILSRITEPTSGRAEIHGRVGSLLEVGTGFHPELTGRENIYLNGAILGMHRAEIERQFDEIVAFAEIEKFLDTPVKRYSSGMYVRLAFAVAAHLEPEILLVDEVLAVGDAAFQKKCLGKMGDIAHEGRTVLFISHNMAAVGTLCHRAGLLEKGSLVRSGPTQDVIQNYLNRDKSLSSSGEGVGDDASAGFVLKRDQSELLFRCGEPIQFEFHIECPIPTSEVTAGFVIYDAYENAVMGASSKLQGIHGVGTSMRWKFICDLSSVPMNSGKYSASIWFGNPYRDHARFTNAISFEITPGDPFGWGNEVPTSWGSLFWKPRWQISPTNDLLP